MNKPDFGLRLIVCPFLHMRKLSTFDRSHCYLTIAYAFVV